MTTYITIASPNRKNRWIIARSSVGGKGPFQPIAEALYEDTAKRIVEALALAESDNIIDMPARKKSSRLRRAS